MAKDTTSPVDATMLDRVALKELERQQLQVDEPTNPEHFTFTAGRPMPKGFENPRPGEHGHFCHDPWGNYQPEWKSVLIHKVHDAQADPQSFPVGGRRWQVKLGVWTDVPPEVVESLRSAVEEHHEMNFKPQDMVLGKEVEHKVTTRPRFFWQEMASATK